ncbi:MAG: methyltransferase domain-containing protein [Nitrospiraceae bacterium]|nr:methyltransferase domain-containing protein [Nitrospiraceae bacterium]
MNDKDLLRHYLKMKGPDAARWNLSPECLYLEFRMRAAIKSYLVPFAGMGVLNVGIGVGEWDDFLGYWIKDFGSLTSVDIDKSICSLFRYRQRRERHANPSSVVCEDILKTELPRRSFDVVTVVGSTFEEVGETPALFSVCMDLLRPGGRLFAAPIDRNGQATALLRQACLSSVPVIHNKRFSHEKVRLRVIVVKRPRQERTRKAAENHLE